VVREGDEPKKRGWFSRKKSSVSSNHGSGASRPPGPSSASHRRKDSSQSLAEDDLPPREEQVTAAPLETPAPDAPLPADSELETPQDDMGVSHIPKHAGFDFKAIKEVIGKADLNPQEMQIPAPNPFSAPHIPPPTLRSESAPPTNTDPSPPAIPARSPLAAPKPQTAGPSSASDDLSSSLARSMSLNDMRSALEDDDVTSVDEKTPSSSQVFRVPPPLPLSTSDEPLWPDEPARKPTFATRPFDTTSADSSLYRSRPPYNPLHSNGTGSYGLSRVPDNPFTPPDTGLAFGAADGSITFSPLPSNSPSTYVPDPWHINTPSFGTIGSSKKPSSSFNISNNPWQS
jgi:hypothetical protein